MGNGGEDVRSMRSSAFDTITVIYASATGFCIAVKVLEVVVEVD